MTHSFHQSGQQRAFTLIEIMIVVVILGILAAIVVPHFSNATFLARDATLKDDLRFLRQEVQVYKAQHRDVPPGHPSGDRNAPVTEDAFVDQMTQFSNELGETSSTNAAGHLLGPYLSRVPFDPLSDQATVYIVSDGSAMPDANSLPLMNGASPFGWIYKPQTQEWMANLSGSDLDGVAYANY